MQALLGLVWHGTTIDYARKRVVGTPFTVEVRLSDEDIDRDLRRMQRKEDKPPVIVVPHDDPRKPGHAHLLVDDFVRMCELYMTRSDN